MNTFLHTNVFFRIINNTIKHYMPLLLLTVLIEKHFSITICYYVYLIIAVDFLLYLDTNTRYTSYINPNIISIISPCTSNVTNVTNEPDTITFETVNEIKDKKETIMILKSNTLNTDAIEYNTNV